MNPTTNTEAGAVADVAAIDVLRDLARVKVMFQARTIAMVMGLPQAVVVPNSTTSQGDTDA